MPFQETIKLSYAAPSEAAFFLQTENDLSVEPDEQEHVRILDK